MNKPGVQPVTRALPVNKPPPLTDNSPWPGALSFPGQMEQSISQPCMFYKPNKTVVVSTRSGIFKSFIHMAALLVYRAMAVAKTHKGWAGGKVKYQLLWPRQMSARQSDHLRPRGEEKIKRSYIRGICKRPQCEMSYKYVLGSRKWDVSQRMLVL